MTEVILTCVGCSLLTISFHIGIILVERHTSRRQPVPVVPEKVIEKAENRREVIEGERAQVGVIEE